MKPTPVSFSLAFAPEGTPIQSPTVRGLFFFFFPSAWWLVEVTTLYHPRSCRSCFTFFHPCSGFPVRVARHGEQFFSNHFPSSFSSRSPRPSSPTLAYFSPRRVKTRLANGFVSTQSSSVFFLTVYFRDCLIILLSCGFSVFSVCVRIRRLGPDRLPYSVPCTHP